MPKKKLGKSKKDQDWAEAKKRCRLNAETVKMAKELGMSPRSLIKNIPSKSQQWKAPVHEWVRDLYEKRFGEVKKSDRTKKSKRGNPPLCTLDHTGSKPAHKQKREVAPVEAPPIDESNVDPYAEDLEYDDWITDDDPFSDDDSYSDRRPTQKEIDEQNENLIRRQKRFRRAAERVSQELSLIREVSRIVLFGSVARPLKKEVPRFREYKRSGIAVWHECKDVDLAVWVADTGTLRKLQKARSKALNDLLIAENTGVAHHQVEIFVMEDGSGRYLGRLCTFSKCPKGKPECNVPDCGRTRYLKQHEGFKLAEDGLARDNIIVLYER